MRCCALIFLGGEVRQISTFDQILFCVPGGVEMGFALLLLDFGGGVERFVKFQHLIKFCIVTPEAWSWGLSKSSRALSGLGTLASGSLSAMAWACMVPRPKFQSCGEARKALCFVLQNEVLRFSAAEGGCGCAKPEAMGLGPKMLGCGRDEASFCFA